MVKYKFIYSLFLLTITISSCYTDLDSTNDLFVKKYGKKVKEINQDRIVNDNETRFITSTPPDKEQVIDFFSKMNKSQPYVPIFNIGENQRNHFPDQSTFDNQSKNNPSNSIPSDIFEISYQTQPHPAYRSVVSEYDNIFIPEVDAFGNSTIREDKEYKMIPNQDIQEAVTQINNQKNEDDKIYTKILILEKKELIKQQKNNQLTNQNQFSEIAMIDDYNLAKKTSQNKISKKNKNISKKNDQAKIN